MSDLQFKIIENKLIWTEIENYFVSNKLSIGMYYISKDNFLLERVTCCEEYPVVPKILVNDLKSAKIACLLDYNLRLNLSVIETNLMKRYESSLLIHTEILNKTFNDFIHNLSYVESTEKWPESQTHK